MLTPPKNHLAVIPNIFSFLLSLFNSWMSKKIQMVVPTWPQLRKLATLQTTLNTYHSSQWVFIIIAAYFNLNGWSFQSIVSCMNHSILPRVATPSFYYKPCKIISYLHLCRIWPNTLLVLVMIVYFKFENQNHIIIISLQFIKQFVKTYFMNLKLIASQWWMQLQHLICTLRGNKVHSYKSSLRNL